MQKQVSLSRKGCLQLMSQLLMSLLAQHFRQLALWEECSTDGQTNIHTHR